MPASEARQAVKAEPDDEPLTYNFGPAIGDQRQAALAALELAVWREEHAERQSLADPDAGASDAPVVRLHIDDPAERLARRRAKNREHVRAYWQRQRERTAANADERLERRRVQNNASVRAWRQRQRERKAQTDARQLAERQAAKVGDGETAERP